MRSLLTFLTLCSTTMLLAQAQHGHAGCCAPKTAAAASTPMVCKQTTAELNARKETVLASLKTKVLERKELADGFAFRFEGSDPVLDEVITFIQSERQCCPFFTFGLEVSGEPSVAWLALTGPEGVKAVIREELGLVP